MRPAPHMSIGMAVLTPDATPSASTRAIAAAGLDHVVLGDHVSFINGAGFDGLIGATHELATAPSLRAFVAVYLLPLRHPVLVARQLSSVSERYPDRLTFGVGVGGEDPHEFEVCGIDPRTRGRRMDESLLLLRELLTGAPVTHHGEFFDVDEALILPAPQPPIPIIIGGRSDVALRPPDASATAGSASGTPRDGSRKQQPSSTTLPEPPAGATSNGNTRCRSGAASATTPRPDVPRSLRPWKACTTSRSNDSSATAHQAPQRPSPSSWPRTSRPVAARSTSSRAPPTSTRRLPASPRSAASSMASGSMASGSMGVRSVVPASQTGTP